MNSSLFSVVTMLRRGSLFALCLCVSVPAVADPCGMVPPITPGGQIPIARVGYQQTYVFFKDGVETFVIRPGFKGSVDNFGMLIPFPSVPELRKVSDNIFPHLAAAVDPPEIVVDLTPRPEENAAQSQGAGQAGGQDPTSAPPKNEIRVLKKEAVGMYEVVVLEAGSAKALKKWMDEHKYVYPKGMDDPVNDYVKDRWCFVAVKTRVGTKTGSDPEPGSRNINNKMPKGSTFDGHVQAMGFRFRTPKLVVPMRLGTFNAGNLHNIVYVLTETGVKIDAVPEEYVVRQLSGSELYRNVTGPLPLRIIGGTVAQLSKWHKRNLKTRRDPQPHNGAARDVFAGDLLAVKEGRLSLPHEEAEKMLLSIGEELGLRGGQVDRLNVAALTKQRDATVNRALSLLKSGMTLTVIDGNFPRKIISEKNLTFSDYKMPARRNSSRFYDALRKKPGPQKQGTVVLEAVSQSQPQPARGAYLGLAVVIGFVVLGVFWYRRSPRVQ